MSGLALALAMFVASGPSASHFVDPFDTYMSGVEAKRPGRELSAFAAERRPFFRHERWAKLFLETLYHYRPERYLLHGYVLMPDHFHVLMTPAASLEVAMQCLKGGFSFRAKRELGWKGEVWVRGFSDHRIRDDEDFRIHFAYIARNPVKARLVESPGEYLYSSANGQFELDPFPRGLKPQFYLDSSGTAEAVPFQGNDRVATEAVIFQNNDRVATEAVIFQNNDRAAMESVPFQNNDQAAAESNYEGAVPLRMQISKGE
jgi:putative transposase